MRAYVDHDPTAWHDDAGVIGTRPDGVNFYVGLRPAVFTAGRLKIAAITAMFREA
jgi:hypothetical protein